MDETLSIPNWFYDLKKIPGCSEAVIAGGYIRDQILSKASGVTIPPQDIDVFIPLGSKKSTYNHFEQLMLSQEFYSFAGNNFNLNTWKFTGQEYADYNDTKIVGKVSVMWGELKVEFIGVAEPFKTNFHNRLIDSFPVNLQQVCFDGEEVYHTPAFVDGLPSKPKDQWENSGCFTFMHIPSRHKYLPRLMAKYIRLNEYLPKLKFSLGDHYIVKDKADENLKLE